tara:strand:- start:180 stop:473 length:294 start_codon:yes stop_codon:yes gene_type:complete
LKLNVLSDPDPFGNRDCSVSGIDADQVAHQEGTAWFWGSAGSHQQSTSFDAQEEGVFHQFAFLVIELGKNPLQAGNRRVAFLVMTEFEQHVPFSLLD